MIVSDAAIKNRVTVGVLVLMIVIAGVYSYVTIPREAAPDVPIPYIMVSTPYEGVSPEDIESSITIKIEKKLTGLKGVKEIRSSSAEGNSLIVIEFQPDVAVEDALQYVRDKVEQAKSDLPSAADEPVVSEISIAEMPVMYINVSGPVSAVQLKEIADKLEDAIEQNVGGVLNVVVLGGLEREIRIEIDQDRLASFGLTLGELLMLIPSENVNISAGSLDTPGTKFNVRVPAEFVDPGAINYLLLTVRSGKPIYLSDVARVTDTFKDRLSYSRINGESSISLAIQKRVGENLIDISRQVRAVIAEARKRAPRSVSFKITMDFAKDIKSMVSDLENTIASALVLVVLVLMVFMGFRASVVVAMAIPLSMLLSFAIIQLVGYTLNMIVLFSLVLAVGMLVDNAIVVVENVYRHMQLGYSRVEAARKGVSEVAWPVITSTLTTVAAFSPMLFWPGIVGDFMGYLPATVIIVLLSSLFVAMVVSPVMCTLIPGRARGQRKHHPLLHAYRKVLSLALNHRFTTISLCVLLLAALGVLYKKRGHGIEFFPELDPNRAVINIRSPQGTSIAESDRLAGIVEQRVAPYQEQLEYLLANIGSSGSAGEDGGAIFGGVSSGPHMANLTLIFPDFEKRERPSANVVKALRRSVGDIAGAEIKVEKEQQGPPTGAPVAIRIVGEDFKKLQDISERARRIIRNVPNLVSLRSDLEAARPELVFVVDRRRAMLSGVNSLVVGNFLKTTIFGSTVSTFRQFNEEYDITVRLPASQRNRIEDIFRLRVPTSTRRSVPLSSLGHFVYKGGYGTINRIDRRRVITLTGDAAEGALANDVLNHVTEWLSPLGRSTLITSDIRDWGGFCRDLSGSSVKGPAAGDRISELLSKKAGRLVEQCARGTPLNFKDKDAILESIEEKVLRNRKFYREEDFSGLKLPDQATGLLKRDRGDLSDEEVRRLNRLLLETSWADLMVKADRLQLPHGYEIDYAGQKEEQDKASAFLFRALIFALLLIVLVLVTQFNTLSVPLVIMFTVVLSMVGVLVGLLAFQMPFGVIMTGIGVISLAGVVVNNSIVLLAYTRRLQKQGMTVMAAAIEAGVTRFRPVMLTATTTIIALLPVLIGKSFDFHTFRLALKSESSEWWQSMAVAVVFGLSFATVLTLVVVPSLYVTLYRLAARFGKGGLKEIGDEVGQPSPPNVRDG